MINRVSRSGELVRTAALLTALLTALPIALSLGISPRLSAAEGDGSSPSLESVGATVLSERPGAGEQCLVCRQAVEGAQVAEVSYRGRRFFVRTDMLDEFCADPETYFRQLEARGGLFDERAVLDAGGMSGPWFWLGLATLAGLITAAAAAYLAIGRRRSPVLWFFVGLIASVAGVLAIVFLPRGEEDDGPEGVPGGLSKVPTTRAPVDCPHCGASNHPAAPACSGCDHDLTPEVRAETAPISL